MLLHRVLCSCVHTTNGMYLPTVHGMLCRNANSQNPHHEGPASRNTQYNTVHPSTLSVIRRIQYNTIQYNTIRFDTIRYNVTFTAVHSPLLQLVIPIVFCPWTVAARSILPFPAPLRFPFPLPLTARDTAVIVIAPVRSSIHPSINQSSTIGDYTYTQTPSTHTYTTSQASNRTDEHS